MCCKNQSEARRNESSGPQGMYVIFPADELIYMTYGAAIPRFKPRPTLDNLREPLVPFDPLPSRRSNPQSPSTSIDIRNNSNRSTSGPVNVKTTNPIPVPVPVPITNTKTKTEQTQRNQPKKSSKKGKQTTDIFGCTPTTVESREPSFYTHEERIETGNAVPIPQLTRTLSTPSPSSSSSLPLPSPSASLTSNAKQVLATTPTTSNGKSSSTKSKSRLHISFGRSKSTQQPNHTVEPARLRDITEIRIANPTFTRENILARNYDAFFESGEPVYSLEYRTPVMSSPTTTSDPFGLNTSTTKQSHTFGLFSKMSKTKDTAKVNARSRSSDPMSTVFEKGDRQRHKNKP